MNRPAKIKVAIDLTPLKSGGENGGAKTLITTLLKDFSTYRADEIEYLLIAEPWNYEELETYQTSNIVCLLRSDIYSAPDQEPLAAVTTVAELGTPLRFKTNSLGKRGIGTLKRILKKVLLKFPRIKEKLQATLLKPQSSTDELFGVLTRLPLKLVPEPRILQREYGVNLLFCPFSAPTFAEAGLPLVAIAYDLQHLDLPFFFDSDERFHRTRFLQDLVRKSKKIICISDFTRQSLITHFKSTPEQLSTIPICIHERLQPRPETQVNRVLVEKGLNSRPYLFFPANFWPHKNHRLLLAAYSIYKRQFADQSVDLVFTGALEESQLALKEFVHQLGYEQNIHFLGFLSEDELIAIWQGAQGLIFPSLYEGFGIPLLEAMWFGKPIACSNVGSLPEVGGDAVIYFDPRRPEAVAQAMGQLAHDIDLTKQLKEKAKDQLQRFDRKQMTEAYLDIFKSALAAT